MKAPTQESGFGVLAIALTVALVVSLAIAGGPCW
jgi:hypothetical protein